MSPRIKNAIILIGVVVSALIVLGGIGGYLYVTLFTDKTINIDMVTIVSILLALFSIFISMLFYFKTTETSNQFYITSNDHMKKQSELLGRIEERFGEKLNNVEKLLAKAQGISLNFEETNDSLNEVVKERDELYKKLLENKNAQGAEREKLTAELEEKQKRINELLEQNKINSIEIKEFINQINNSNSINSSRYDFNNYRNKEQQIIRYLYQLLNNANIRIDQEFDNLIIELNYNNRWADVPHLQAVFVNNLKQWLLTRPQIPKKKTINFIIRQINNALNITNSKDYNG